MKRAHDNVSTNDNNELRFKLSKNLKNKQFDNWDALRNTLAVYDFGSGTIDERIDFEYLEEAQEQVNDKDDPDIICVSQALGDTEYRNIMENITEEIQECMSHAWAIPNNMAQRIDIIQKQARLFSDLSDIGFFKYL